MQYFERDSRWHTLCITRPLGGNSLAKATANFVSFSAANVAAVFLCTTFSLSPKAGRSLRGCFWSALGIMGFCTVRGGGRFTSFVAALIGIPRERVGWLVSSA